ncbi:hypothetical protein Tco_0021129, partial [Tanacetum coccineum]
DFNRDSESLIAGRVLDGINHNLKGLFLWWHGSLESYIGGTDLDFVFSGKPTFHHEQ